MSGPEEGPSPGKGGGGRLPRPPAEARGPERGLLPFPAPRGASPPPGHAAALRPRLRLRPRPRPGARGRTGPPWRGQPGPQRGERVLNKCLWRRRGRRLPRARVLALMHCAPRAEEAAPAFSATAAAAARVRAARGRISHTHAARCRRRRRGLKAAGGPGRARGACPVAGPRQESCDGRASSAPPP